MRPSVLKRERLAKQTRELSLFRHINAPTEEPLPQDVQDLIEARVAQGQITVCPPGARTLKAPVTRHRVHTPVFTRMTGKL